MASLEGLKTGYPRVPNSASDLRLCNVILTVTTCWCPYVSVATDTIGTRESRFGGLPGVIDAEPARPDLRRGDVPVDADGCSFASFSSLPAEPADAPGDVTVWLTGVGTQRS